jgi:uncharacterized protein
MSENDPELEDSTLSQAVTRDGITIQVCIYRIKDSGEGWILEVVDDQGTSTVWGDPFATDRDAYSEFQRVLAVEGIRSFSETRH